MRTTNSIKNISISILSQFIIAILGFISRKVFLDSLGAQYLGVNGLLTNVLSMLALVESGIGISIVYSLYKPLAENDQPKIIAYVRLYKKAYAVVAIIIFLLSLVLYPFLGKLMKDESVSYISVVYFIFVAKNMITYFNAHKASLIYADQKGFVLEKVIFVFQVLTMIARIIILILTKNYILYLLIEILIFSAQTIFNGRIVDKRYSYIKTKEVYSIDAKEKQGLIKNIKAIFFHNLGSYIVFGTDNILISSFIGVIAVGIYSNYTMIIGQVGSLISPLMGGIGASVGNLIAIESNNKSYSVFKVVYLVNFWIYSVFVIFLYNLLNPFINWWLGSDFLLDSLTFIIILVNWYLTGLRASIATFKTKAGMFVQDKYVPLIEGAINLGTSLILVHYIGLAGIFLGTFISTLSVVFWNVPRLVFKYVFKVPVGLYFTKYILYTFLTIVTCFLTTTLCHVFVTGDNFLSLIVKGIICLIVPNVIYIAVFSKSEEFQYIKNAIWTVISSTKLKMLSRSNV